MGINVLSLFDGMSCGQIALDKLGIKVDNYFAAEIKKHAIETTQRNYPNTIKLGDVTKISAKDLPKIDLFIGGSPCQDFSAQNKERKGLDGIKSNLFFEYLRLKNECNPEYWILENVMMLPEHFAALSRYMETYPFETNGALVSAAYRRRLFWTNIGPYYNDLFGFRHCDIPQPKDKNIKLQSILTEGFTDRIKCNCLKTTNGGSLNGDYEHDYKLVKKRYFDSGFDNVVFNSPDFDIRKGVRFFNRLELERLHNIPPGYTANLNTKKAHDLIGDGWTVDIVVHILSFINNFEKIK